MRNLTASSASCMITRVSLAVTLLSLSPSTLPAQTTATDQDIRALREEVSELKSRLAELETKLAALPPAARPAGDKLMANAIEPQPSPAALFTAAVPPATATEQVASKPAPFAFGDFTWMNGQSRQKTQPLANSFATVSLYLDTYYGYSFNQPRDDTIVGSGAVGRNTVLSGVPTTPGSFPFTVRVTDSGGTSQTATAMLTLTIASQQPVTVTSPDSAIGCLDIETFTASSSNVTWTDDCGANCSISQSGSPSNFVPNASTTSPTPVKVTATDTVTQLQGFKTILVNPSLSPAPNGPFQDAGGSGTVTVNVQGPWTLSIDSGNGNSGWLTFAGGALSQNGTGIATVNYFVAANLTQRAFTGHLILDSLTTSRSQSLEIDQNQCSICVLVTPTPPAQGGVLSFAASGGNGSFMITTGGNWTVTGPSFVTFTNATSGTGNRWRCRKTRPCLLFPSFLLPSSTI
jgi:hypothetical protein